MSEPAYSLGHAATELERLTVQAQALRPITERLLREAGIARGMRVLDLGCGAGDVSLLLAEFVGRDGSVVAIDRSETAVATARDRIRRAGAVNVTLHHASVRDFVDGDGFDLAVGRYVLIFQEEPAQFIADVARLVRPGGVVAFHEIDEFTGGSSVPQVPLWDRITNVVMGVMRRIVTTPDAAQRLAGSFEEAGLGAPSLICERVVGSHQSTPMMAWMASTFREVLPRAQELGLIAAGDITVDNLETRVHAAVAEAHAQIVGPDQYCAWARV
ncbi:class I SAM-dependent methyltransferase [Bradyrhizobium sp. SYSU BS000235]|uniref:class I SAM-dependent methyltransferase n=1 Tax=Bradyrhizobium sp. SYSU BS000235 TaxID=3411332 RepID=UPI003C73A9C1